MRLYLSGNSKNQLGYTADWIAFDFEENGKGHTLTLDLYGCTDFDNNNLSLRFKGDLMPWVYDDEDLSTLSEEESRERFSVEQIVDIIKKAFCVRVGLYPECNEDEMFEKAENDDITDCAGTIEIWCDNELFEHDFEFEYELNIY